MVGIQVYKCCLNYLKSIYQSRCWSTYFIKLQLVGKHSVFPQESNINFSGSNDKLVQALGTPEYTGYERGKGKYYMGKEKYYTPQQYFNSIANHVVREILKVTKEQQAKFEANVLAKLSHIRVPTQP